MFKKGGNRIFHECGSCQKFQTFFKHDYFNFICKDCTEDDGDGCNVGLIETDIVSRVKNVCFTSLFSETTLCYHNQYCFTMYVHLFSKFEYCICFLLSCQHRFTKFDLVNIFHSTSSRGIIKGCGDCRVRQRSCERCLGKGCNGHNMVHNKCYRGKGNNARSAECINYKETHCKM